MTSQCCMEKWYNLGQKYIWTNVHISIIRQSISEHSASIMTRSCPLRFISEIYRVDLRRI